MSNKYIKLKNRTLISISGDDRISFLQGLTSNDVNLATQNQAIYSVMLNPQGRFLHDFFILSKEESLLLDVNKLQSADLIKKLNMYKLRAKVDISELSEDYQITAFIGDNLDKISDGENIFPDPRNKLMGYRAFLTADELLKISQNDNLQEADLNFYNYHRFQLKIADDSDLGYDKSLIIEYGFDNFNAINYQKGCYVGQETTARTHYKGVIRKGLYLVEIPQLQEVEHHAEITCEDKKIGLILSSIKFDNHLKSLALIKNIDRNNDNIDLNSLDLKVADSKISIIN